MFAPPHPLHPTCHCPPAPVAEPFSTSPLLSLTLPSLPFSCDHTDDVVNKRLKHREAVVGNTPSLNRLAQRFVTFVTTVQDSEASSSSW